MNYCNEEAACPEGERGMERINASGNPNSGNYAFGSGL